MTKNSGTYFNSQHNKESLSVLIKDDFVDEPDELVILSVTCVDDESRIYLRFFHRIMIRDDDGN